MIDGLGPRYAFYGPFGVMHLNANGIEDYNRRYGSAIEQILKDFGPIPNFSDHSMNETLAMEMNAQIGVSRITEHLRDRDRKLAELCKIKKRLKAEVQNDKL
ncbi:hypothetical protein AB6A40_010024 [Gnathostoma spinigerum]|uniref:Uncharacterized protein n=1 Tax=Gnathostoma spinigerum TaxID=75299 RepID=A0ABD6ETL7_9BILA